MGWSVSFACCRSADPAAVFRPGVTADPAAAASFARGLYPAATLTETGDTVLDFALRPYDDEVFVGAYDGAVLLCDRRLFCLDDDARRIVDRAACALPGASCGVLVLESVVASCWFRWYDAGVLRREVLVTAEDGVVVDQGARLPAEEPFWRELDGGAADVPLPFDQEDFGLALAGACIFGRGLAERGADGFLPLELPVRRFKLS
ncbi:DUF6928 family protein [Actinomadura rayongensis]|uniref:Uncharacterized protein n=1 Tax=Actinomadura rayongensis TaxID=1429076 RepID=A0A6I4WEM6_9ACTN|nr:hypothetical protein [Actinomadura rayongensis]MXQ67503.1 hypothetical protein [Actinomadura rayongensis]